MQNTLTQNETNFPVRAGFVVCLAIFVVLASWHDNIGTTDSRGWLWGRLPLEGQPERARREGNERVNCYRTSTTVDGRSSAYTANTLNQYTQRVVPGELDILGSALLQATVTVNNQASQRKNDYFYKTLTIDNSSAPQFPEVNVVAVKNNYGGNGEDLIGNQTGHHYLAKTPETFSYGNDGNLLSDGRWQHTWDGEPRHEGSAAVDSSQTDPKGEKPLGKRSSQNRLIVIESLSGAPTASKKKLEFGYDDQGRRISKKVYEWNGSAYTLGNETRFLYDGWNLVAELNGSNAVQKNFVWGADLSGNYQNAGGIGGLLAIKQSSTSYYPSYDGIGNVTALIKANNQTVAGRYHYGAFGEPIQTFENGIENPFRFSTKYHDEETNFAYYGYRFYDASLGRWLSQDPLGESGGANLYGFVYNNPTNSVDVLGMWPEVAGIDWGRKESWSAMGQGFGEGLSQSTAEFGNAAYYDLQLFNHAFYSTFGDVGGALSQTNDFLAANGADLNAIPMTRGEVGLAKGLVIFGAWGKATCKIAQYENRVDQITNIARSAKTLSNPYVGIRQASQYLQEMGVSRVDRVRYLQSFEPQNIVVRQAGRSEFGLRFFSDPNRAGGQYLFETFPASRSSLAIKPEWSTMIGFRQFQIRPGATILEGRAAPQGPYLSGGYMQKFILDWRSDLIAP